MEPYEIDLTLAAARRTSEENAAFTPPRTRLGIPRLTGVAAAAIFGGGAVLLLILGLRAVLLLILGLRAVILAVVDGMPF